MPMNARIVREREGIYLLQCDAGIYVYPSYKCSDFMISKARLIGENLLKHEHKSRGEVIVVGQHEDNQDFWGHFEGKEQEMTDEEMDRIVSCVYKIYQVNFAKRFLELPQAANGRAPLLKEVLNTTQVYILDTISVIYIWSGRKSPNLLYNAALKLSEELFIMIPRPRHSSIKFFREGDESLFFKSCFTNWDSLLSLGCPARLKMTQVRQEVKQEQDQSEDTKKMKHDTAAFFLPRKGDLSGEECDALILDMRESCEILIAFVFVGRRKFVQLPKEDWGHFQEDTCYLFICRETLYEDDEDVTFPAYFWQGACGPVGAWLQFSLCLKTTLETTLNDSLDIVRLEQQKEDFKFLALFNRRFVIHKTLESDDCNKMFQLRSTAGSITLRCIEVGVNVTNLNSNLCCLLVVPFESDGDMRGIVYVWIGSKSQKEEADIGEEIALNYYGSRGYAVSVIDEGSEPEDYFWNTLGGKDVYDKEGYFLGGLRLFRAFTENECFTVVEKCTDFSKSDLSDKYAMVLDDKRTVFVWLPLKVVNTDVRLVIHASSVYIKHLARIQPMLPRKLSIQREGKESSLFRRCFHGWRV